MKIALASDHAGFELKQSIGRYLAEKDVAFVDFGCDSNKPVNYVEFGIKAIQAVLAGICDRAVLVCGTGVGMAIVANKFKGIRAAVCWNVYTAEVSRKHNDANCLTLGGRILNPEEARRIVQVWLDALFEDGRHEERLNKIKDLEERNFRPS